MLHIIGFVFFSVLFFTTGCGLVAILLNARDAIGTALGLNAAPVVTTAPGVARVRVRYVSTARRVMPPLRAVA
ncbi:hypothetical protein [Sphingomonas montana]|uniref:hypothetical protein n=1 Tax=Sphingomonas montana TaxID=1843236 RepID=UPI00101AE2BC|nr:hypothetical protein [Sphingomonas montana]